MTELPRECVAFMLVKDGALLVERRSHSKAVDPGATAIPGGHLEAGETPEAGLERELAEELELEADSYRYVCSLLNRSEELRLLHYYAVESWQGEMANNEADELIWIPLDDPQPLSLEVDRTAIREYLRLYG
jgi:8-oxo-dGTP pyrophosphatase MutT (NUDIX family)